MKKFYAVLLEELGLCEEGEAEKIKGIDLSRAIITSCIAALMIVGTIKAICDAHEGFEYRQHEKEVIEKAYQELHSEEVK